jgi:hypothetical protein
MAAQPWLDGFIGPRELREEGVAVPFRPVVDFVGDNVTVTDDPDNGVTIVTIEGGEGASLTPPDDPLDDGKLCVAFGGDLAWIAGIAAGQAAVWNGSIWGPGNPYGAVVTYSDAAVTLQLSDAGKYVRLTHATPALTVPPNSTVAFPIGTLITGVTATGAGTFVEGSGVTINKPADRELATVQAFSPWALKKVATNEWDLCGELEFS